MLGHENFTFQALEANWPQNGADGRLTSRVPIEHQLRETEGRFRVMADCAPVLLWMARTDTLCDFFNQSWLQFTGRTQEEEWGVGWTEGVHPEDFQKCVDIYMAAFRERKKFSMEYRLRRHDGEYRWLLDQGVPRYASGGRFMGYIGSCVDITDRKEVEKERIEMLTKLEETLKIREEFMAIASHELKTPLTSLKLQIQLLKRHLKEGIPSSTKKVNLLQGAVSDSEQQVDRLVGLVDDLLDVSRVSSGRLTVEREEMDLVELVQRVIAKFSPQIMVSKSSVVLDGDPSVKGSWDPFRLEQVIMNLLTNALKYGAGEPITITISSDGCIARCLIHDQGIGISQDSQERIFSCFERAVSYKNFGGLGLGLYISRQIIVTHGGTMRVESELGKGATFIFELPVA